LFTVDSPLSAVSGRISDGLGGGRRVVVGVGCVGATSLESFSRESTTLFPSFVSCCFIREYIVEKDRPEHIDAARYNMRAFKSMDSSKIRLFVLW
jgi:hypothetical protein